MEGFDHILNWKLKAGSHQFPGKDGGTCINEAAVVAAGFRYRPVRWVEEMPTCFSRPICRLALRLNDQATDTERQRLMLFVTRLACADTATIERQRQPTSPPELHAISVSKEVSKPWKERLRSADRLTRLQHMTFASEWMPCRARRGTLRQLRTRHCSRR